MLRHQLSFLVSLVGLSIFLLLSSGRASGFCIDYGRYIHWIGSVNTFGNCYDLVVEGPYAFVANGYDGLQVLDVSTPESMQIVANVDASGESRCVLLDGDYAFLASRIGGWHVIDISSPQSPNLVRTVESQHPQGFTLHGIHLYVGKGSSGLDIYDVSDPASPVLLGAIDTPGQADRGALVGDFLLLADGPEGIQIVDVSTPSSPAIVRTLFTGGWTVDIKVVGTHAYVADGDGGFVVLDITNPSNPDILASAELSDFANGLEIHGDRAFVADWAGGLQLIDISDPRHPRLLGGLGGSYAANVAVTEQNAFVASIGDVHAMVIPDLEAPPTLGRLDTAGVTSDVAAHQDYVYLADGSDGLQVVDASDPFFPILVGTLPLPDFSIGVVVADPHAYVATYDSDDQSGTVHVIDISNPESPSLMGTVGVPNTAEGITVAGSYAYVPMSNVGLAVIDISNPVSPQLISTLEVPSISREVAVRDDIAYLVTWSALHTIDISQPDAPTPIGEFELAGYSEGIAVRGDYAYVAGNDLYVIEISDPAQMTLADQSVLPSGGRDLVLGLSFAYVSTSSGGLAVFDVSTGQSAILIGTVVTDGFGRGVAFMNGHAYLTSGVEGLQVLHGQCSSADATSTLSALSHVSLSCTAPMPWPGRIDLTWYIPRPDIVELSVFDSGGRLVRSLYRGIAGAGRHTSVWDGRMNTGRSSASGIYYVSLVTSDGMQVKKLTLLR